jgi:hypothetical protein
MTTSSPNGTFGPTSPSSLMRERNIGKGEDEGLEVVDSREIKQIEVRYSATRYEVRKGEREHGERRKVPVESGNLEVVGLEKGCMA